MEREQKANSPAQSHPSVDGATSKPLCLDGSPAHRWVINPPESEPEGVCMKCQAKHTFSKDLTQTAFGRNYSQSLQDLKEQALIGSGSDDEPLPIEVRHKIRKVHQEESDVA